jgi:hypothetical protein
MKTPKLFVKDFLAKSYDFPNAQIIIDAKDQQAAEEGTPKAFLEKLSSGIKKGEQVHKISLQKGTLTLAQKDANLYSGFFQDETGQIVEKFDAHTLEMVAKTLIVKGCTGEYDLTQSEGEDMETERPVVAPQGMSLKIKFGDVELELRKSVKSFIEDYKSKRADQDLMRKAIKSWRRSQKFSEFTSDSDAAQALLSDWETHKEAFQQTLFAIKQMSRK